MQNNDQNSKYSSTPIAANGSDIKSAPEGEEISIAELVMRFQLWIKYLRSKWLTILLVSILSGMVGLGYSWLTKPVYTATTTFVLESGDEGGAGMGQYAGLASMVGINIGNRGGGIFQGENIIELYRSRTMIEKTLLTELNINGKNELLIDLFLDLNGLGRKIKSKADGIQFNEISEVSNRLRDSILGEAVKEINKNYLVVSKPDKKLSIIEVKVKAENEVFAKAFNEEIVENVNDFYVRTRTKKSLQNVQILQSKTDSVRAVMNGAIYSAASIADETPNLNPTRQAQRAAPIQRSQFTAETNKAILSELVKNLELSKITLLRESPLIQVIDKPILPLGKTKVGRLKGTFVGILLGSFLTVLIVTLSFFYKRMMNK